MIRMTRNGLILKHKRSRLGSVPVPFNQVIDVAIGQERLL